MISISGGKTTQNTNPLGAGELFLCCGYSSAVQGSSSLYAYICTYEAIAASTDIRPLFCTSAQQPSCGYLSTVHGSSSLYSYIGSCEAISAPLRNLCQPISLIKAGNYKYETETTIIWRIV